MQKQFNRVQRKRDLISFGTRCGKDCVDIQPVDRIDIIVMKTVYSARKAAGELRRQRPNNEHDLKEEIRKRGIDRMSDLQ